RGGAASASSFVGKTVAASVSPATTAKRPASLGGACSRRRRKSAPVSADLSRPSARSFWTSALSVSCSSARWHSAHISRWASTASASAPLRRSASRSRSCSGDGQERIRSLNKKVARGQKQSLPFQASEALPARGRDPCLRGPVPLLGGPLSFFQPLFFFL